MIICVQALYYFEVLPYRETGQEKLQRSGNPVLKSEQFAPANISDLRITR
jgi:hypothetical protein